MTKKEQEIILRTLETLLQLELRGVRQMLGEEEVETTLPRKGRLRRQSLVATIRTLLEHEKRPLHVNEMVDLLRKQYGRVTDRDTLSSALAKKAKQGILVTQTAPATFMLLDQEDRQE